MHAILVTVDRATRILYTRDCGVIYCSVMLFFMDELTKPVACFLEGPVFAPLSWHSMRVGLLCPVP